MGLWPISENFADGGDTVESSLNFGKLGIMEPDEEVAEFARISTPRTTYRSWESLRIPLRLQWDRRRPYPKGGIQRSLR